MSKFDFQRFKQEKQKNGVRLSRWLVVGLFFFKTMGLVELDGSLCTKYFMTIYLMSFVRDVRWLHHWNPSCSICVYLLSSTFFHVSTQYTLIAPGLAISIARSIAILLSIWYWSIYCELGIRSTRMCHQTDRRHQTVTNIRIFVYLAMSRSHLAYIGIYANWTKISEMLAHRAIIQHIKNNIN